MTEAPRQAQAGVAGALNELSDHSRALVRHEIAAAQREVLANLKGGLPAFALLGAGGLLGVLSVAASFRLSLRLLEKVLSPTAAAGTATAGFGLAAGATTVAGLRLMRDVPPLFPVETARDAARTVAQTAEQATQDTQATQAD
ncbi:MAG TPA: phage holin family protein [Streptosporangiaceae bacterium]|nr:phage holin family protein [Streptosporangiaceae bacterium]